jgi:hypothetical protein
VAIRSALAAFKWPAGVKYEVNLQGSYKNDTNILAESDVDVLVELTSVVHHNSARLTEREQTRFASRRRILLRVNYGQFREMVSVCTIISAGTASAKRSGKAFKIATPCGLPFPRLLDLPGARLVSHKAKACFLRTAEQRWIVNYPHLHYVKGVAKNEGTAGRFKRTVRLFKNLRSELIDHGRFQKTW